MRGIAFILAFVLALCMFVSTPALAATEVRVYWGVGIVIGGLSIFISFGSGDLSENESEFKTAETVPEENLILANAITEQADISPVHYETPGTLTVFRW
jgi:hypothetical protein